MSRWYLGVDWADREHAVWVEDEAGAKVTFRTVAHTGVALVEFGRWLDEQRAQGVTLWAAIERPDGGVVDLLLDHGVVVYAINPKALDRARDRYRMSHAKSDPFDVRVLAGFLRTDQAHLTPLQPSTEAAQELKLLTRDCQRLVRQQARFRNQLIATLKAYYPRPLELFPDINTPTARSFLQTFPTPEAVTTLKRPAWRRWVRVQHVKHAEALWTKLQAPQVPVPAHVVQARARLLRVLLAQLAATAEAVESYREAIADFFAAMPVGDWARSLPGGQHGTIVPTLLAELGDAPGRWHSVQHLQAQAGMVPVTSRSGKHHVVGFRWACNMHLRYAAHTLAFVSLCRSDWAPAYYRQQRARGHGHHRALRALGAKWLKIIFTMWVRQVPYDENYHLAMMARQQFRQVA